VKVLKQLFTTTWLSHSFTQTQVFPILAHTVRIMQTTEPTPFHQIDKSTEPSSQLKV